MLCDACVRQQVQTQQHLHETSMALIMSANIIHQLFILFIFSSLQSVICSKGWEVVKYNKHHFLVNDPAWTFRLAGAALAYSVGRHRQRTLPKQPTGAKLSPAKGQRAFAAPQGHESHPAIIVVIVKTMTNHHSNIARCSWGFPRLPGLLAASGCTRTPCLPI